MCKLCTIRSILWHKQRKKIANVRFHLYDTISECEKKLLNNTLTLIEFQLEESNFCSSTEAINQFCSNIKREKSILPSAKTAFLHFSAIN